MVLLKDNLNAFVFPPRCGTRWISTQLKENNLIIDEGASTHAFKSEFYRKDLNLFMIVRNPFKRERSFYRWQQHIGNKEIINRTFEEYVLNDRLFFNNFNWVSYYKTCINLVSEFVHLEEIHDFFLRQFNIKLPPYNQEYHAPVDPIEDENSFTSAMIERVLEKYRTDIQVMNLNLSPFC